MFALSPIIYAFCRGLADSVKGTVTVFTLDKNIAAKASQLTPQKETPHASSRKRHREGVRKSNTIGQPNVLKTTLQCCGLNGGLCWLTKMLFDHCVIPILFIIVEKVFGEHSSTRTVVTTWLETILDIVFSTFWIIPIFILCKIINSLWFQDIADSAYHYTRGRPQKMASISRFIADWLFNVVVQMLFLVQAYLVSLVPGAMLGQLLSICHMCLLYSLYAFEYKWSNMGLELHRRLTFIEANWPYFLGFGLPLTVLTSLTPSFLTSGCLFSILFPLFIISGNDADPVTGSCDFSLKLFSPVVSLSNSMFNRSFQKLRQ